MIEEISIRDLGTIAESTLPLGPGFTVLTGETGAGKTMVVSALGLLLGGRSDSSVVRAGSPQAQVEGRWNVPDDGAVAERVREAGGAVDDGELILARSVSQEGRSRAYVGGRSSPVGVLGELGEQLVVVHGQSDQMRLRSAVAQREVLDRFAGAALLAVSHDYRSTYREWHDTRTALDELVAERDLRAAEAERLRAAIDRIEALAPQPGEDAELAGRAERLSNLEDLRIAAAHAHELLSSDEVGPETADALVLLDGARRQIERVAPHDELLAPIAEQLVDAIAIVADVTARLSGYLSDLDADGSRELELVQERRAALAALVRDHGPTLDDAVAFLDTGSARLLELDTDADRIGQLATGVDALEQRLWTLADELSALRSAAAVTLAERVTVELGALAMAHARLIVEVIPRESLGATGRDDVSVLLQPHPGSDPQPVGRGASGGELSRVMLAIEVVIAGSDPVPTFVFDEVDAGIGGAAAIEVGRRLQELSRGAQVIVVTHLAQVAAFATNHLRVARDDSGSVTASSVSRLEGAERIAEMARLLSGLTDSSSALDHARELVEMAAS